MTVQANVDFGGPARAGQNVNVYDHGTQTPTTIYDTDGVTPLTQPIPVRGNGHVSFSAAPGTYDVVGPDLTRTVVLEAAPTAASGVPAAATDATGYYASPVVLPADNSGVAPVPLALNDTASPHLTLSEDMLTVTVVDAGIYDLTVAAKPLTGVVPSGAFLSALVTVTPAPSGPTIVLLPGHPQGFSQSNSLSYFFHAGDVFQVSAQSVGLTSDFNIAIEVDFTFTHAAS